MCFFFFLQIGVDVKEGTFPKMIVRSGDGFAVGEGSR